MINSLMQAPVNVEHRTRKQSPRSLSFFQQNFSISKLLEEQELHEQMILNLGGMHIQLKLSVYYLLSYDFVLHFVIYSTICMH